MKKDSNNKFVHVQQPQRGHFASLKMGQMIKFRSSIEYDFMYWLEFASCVDSYSARTARISYEEYDVEKEVWKTRHFRPDFHIIKSDGTNLLVEVTASVFVNSTANKRRYEAARQWCN